MGGLDSEQGTGIVNADLKIATEASLLQAGAFEGVAEASASRYALAAFVVQQAKPMFGASFTVDVEIAWTLTDRRDGRVLLRKVLASSGTAGAFDGFAAVTRIRLATEAAVRANLDRLLDELGGLAY